MIIFLVLILLLVGLIAAFIFLNVKNYYDVQLPKVAAQDQNYFSPNANYYTLYDSWLDLTVGSIEDGGNCYSNITCKSRNCRCNPVTNQCMCIPATSSTGSTDSSQPQYSGFTEPSKNDNNASALYNYGSPYFYTAICAQKQVDKSQTPESYFPSYKSQTLIEESLSSTSSNSTPDNPTSFVKTCKNYTFQQTPLDTTTTTCYDSDQLAGTKIVEMCQATPGTNQICINNNGDRVYAPTLNSLYIKPSLTLCEDNTSINYLSFNFNNVPQTIDTLIDQKEDGVNLYGNQLLCLSVDTIDYYPDISITSYGTNSYYLTFSGTWGYQYSYTLSGTSIAALTIDTSTDLSTFPWYDVSQTVQSSPEATSLKQENSGRITIDFAYGITYKIPKLSLGSNGFSISGSTTTYPYGTNVDVISETTNEITTSTSLKPCAPFNPSYYTGTGSNNIETLDDGYVDKQKFKISRFSMSKGKLEASTEGMVSSIVYRNLNYENGGLYLDYYTPYQSSITQGSNTSPSVTFEINSDNTEITVTNIDNISKFSDGSGTLNQGIYNSTGTFKISSSNNSITVSDLSNIVGFTSNTVPSTLLQTSAEQLVLRKVNKSDLDSTKLWILMPPQSLSPYTIPSGDNMWCNYCQDTSTDGGNTFNGKTSVIVPMKSNQISEGTEIIDPLYNQLVKQPDNKVFNAIGDAVEGVGEFAAGVALAASGPLGAITAGVELYGLTKQSNSSFNWHLLNNDPSFSKCAQLCSKVIPFGSTPKVKAVATNSGTLGSIPPGHSRGLTQKFAEGDVVAGIKLGGVTCQNYYLYDTDSSNPTIASRTVGESFVDGNVEFIVQSTYDNTYMFPSNYFNNKGTIIINNVASGGSGYGKTNPPKKVINGFNPIPSTTSTDPYPVAQKLIYGITSSSPPTTTTACSVSNLSGTSPSQCSISSETVPPILSNSALCKTDTTVANAGVNILNTLTGRLNKLSTPSNNGWYINAGSTEIPLKITFSSSVCNSSTLGLENYYSVVTSRINFPLTNGSDVNTVDISSSSDFNTYFPTISSTSTTQYQVYQQINGQSLYDSSGNPLMLTVSYGDFSRQYRLYYNTTYVAQVSISNLDSNGSVETEDIQILEMIDESTILNNIGSEFDLQEWWVIATTYGETVINVEYNNTNASGCKVRLTDSTDDWSILNPAPSDLLRTEVNEIQSVKIINGGSSYDSSSPVTIVQTINGVTNSSAIGGITLDPLVKGKIQGVTLIDRGSRYDSSKTVTIIQGSVTGATASITVDTDDEINPLSFPSSTQPIDLKNNVILKHGNSPQQIVYAGSFQKDNSYCYSEYPQNPNGGTFLPEVSPDPQITITNTANQQNFVNCNADTRCSFNQNVGYCTGRNLIEYSYDAFGDLFTTTQSFTASNLFNVKNDVNDEFTNLTFLKSLQIPVLNYDAYNAMPTQPVEGASPTFYYTPPNFINYSNQQIDGPDIISSGLKLGKYIPYQYFYPNFVFGETETSKIQDTVKIDKQNQKVNNFYVNLNYAQFIPYGKKSLYENGFTKQSDVPTF